MSDKEDTRRDYLSITAVDPVDGKPCAVMISYDRMQTVGRRSLGQAKECAFILPTILQYPTAIFEGLRRDEDDDPRGCGWRCYCGIPEHAYLQDGTEIRPFPGQVYLVFVNDEKVAYNWRWEKADPDNLRFPANHPTRFRKCLLP